MIGILATCFIIAFLLPFISERYKTTLANLVLLLPISIFLFLMLKAWNFEDAIISKTSWAPSLGLNLDFRIDGLSLFFGLIISGIGSLVFFYTSSYLKNDPKLNRFYSFLILFMGAMLGLVFADNLMLSFLFWELTSISSFFLIGYKHKDEGSRKSALQALSITGLGGLSFLISVVLINYVSGAESFSMLLNESTNLQGSNWYISIVVFLFLAVFTKSAQFPFHFWLPAAMKAPTPVSTYLHSATMVKAGIYLIYRFTPILGGTEIWTYTLTIIGMLTMVYGAWQSLFRTDLKAILAYTTIAALGIITSLIGMGTKASLLAALLFTLIHAIYKAGLFLVAGIIDHSTHSRDASKLSGLYKKMPLIAVIAFIVAMSNGGVPLSFGFIGKDLIYEASLALPKFAIAITIVFVLSKILIFYAGFAVALRPFSGKVNSITKNAHTVGFRLWLPAALLSIATLILGAYPASIENFIIRPALFSLTQQPTNFHLAVFHGFNSVLLLSTITIIGGSLLYFFMAPSEQKQSFISRFETLSPSFFYQNLIHICSLSFKHISTFFQNGYLRHYIAFILLFFLIFILPLSLKVDFLQGFLSLKNLTFYEWMFFIILIVSVIFTINSNSRLAAVAALGVVGLSICLIFLFYSAPDLAMTQFTIDTLTVILFVLVLYKLPKYLPFSNRLNKLKDAILAIGISISILGISLAVINLERSREIESFYADNAYILAKGKNIVNVILVDFRGLDTLVEITVLTIAAIGVFGLLKLWLRIKKE